MEQKLVRVPFEVELAKKIQNKECEGRIVTRNGRNVRIICFDAHCDDNIVALIEDEKGVEYSKSYVSDGMTFLTGECDCDLILEVPEYMTFKDGDIIAYDDRDAIVILKGEPKVDDDGIVSFRFYVNMFGDNLNFYSDRVLVCVNSARKATPEEIQKLKDRLEKDDRLEAQEYLKRFFGIEPEQFKDGDILFVKTRDDSEYIFVYKDNGKDKTQFYVALDYDNVLWTQDNRFISNDGISELRKATEAERQKLIDAMRESKRGEVKECLKRISKAEQKKKGEFNPFDKVLVRNLHKECWKARFFDRKVTQGGDDYFYVTSGTSFKQIIPYEGNEHLHGTTDDYKA